MSLFVPLAAGFLYFKTLALTRVPQRVASFVDFKIIKCWDGRNGKKKNSVMVKITHPKNESPSYPTHCPFPHSSAPRHGPIPMQSLLFFRPMRHPTAQPRLLLASLSCIDHLTRACAVQYLLLFTMALSCVWSCSTPFHQ